MATVLFWYVGVTLALAALLAIVICGQLIAQYSRRRHLRSIRRGGPDQAQARRGRDAA